MATRSRELLDLETVLSKQYTLERELGRGGMGVVFLARDLRLDRLVAIKALPLHLADDERVRERFLREARTAARLSHPNIVPIHRADEIDGRVFFVMGYVDGESLAQRVTDRGALPAGEVVALLRDVAAALHEAHRLGIVHRDVKAENILFDQRTGRAMVTDFGIARVAEASPLTATGLLLGTVQYMSPEQVVGETVDARSDVYSLGVVAFHALTARFPFQSESASAVLVAHVTKTPPKIRDIEASIPLPLAEIVDRCLAKEPAQRFQSAGEVGDALSTLSPSILPAPRRQDSTPAAKESDVLLSDREARAVWDRAANLQAQATGTVTPIPPPSRQTERQPLSPSSAYRLDVVRDSAREAGIGTEYVDRALAERGLGEKGAAAPPAPIAPASTPAVALEIRDMRLKPFSRWAGAPSSIEYEVVVDGEISERDYERLVETIRRTLSDVGTVGVIGRSFTWSATDPKRRVHVAVQMRNGRTTIRIAETLKALRGSVFGGGVGGFGGGFGGPLFAMVSSATGTVEVGIAAALTAVATAYFGTRTVYKGMVKSRQTELRGLIARLAEEARLSIAEPSEERKRPVLPRR